MNSEFKVSHPTCFKCWNRFFLFFCSANTFLAYLYQYFCKVFLEFGERIRAKKEDDNFIIKNLPNIGFTLYDEKNLYYNFIPHFLTAFLSALFVYQSEEVLSNLDEELSKSKTKLIQEKKTLKKNEKLSEEKYKNIREEKNEFLQDKMYADKYYENEDSIKSKSKRLITFYIIFLYTKVYWLLLFMSLSIIFSSYDLSFSILLYIIAFVFLFIKSFTKLFQESQSLYPQNLIIY
jgi:alkylhydroperoxidase/carboxymuconolactone decarboxylase family protein YurZ